MAKKLRKKREIPSGRATVSPRPANKRRITSGSGFNVVPKPITPSSGFKKVYQKSRPEYGKSGKQELPINSGFNDWAKKLRKKWKR